MHASRIHRLVSAIALGALLVLPAGLAAQYAKSQEYVGLHVGMSGVGSAAAVGLNGEVAYNQNIGIGAWVDTWSYGQSFGTALGNASWNVRYIALAGTGAYHFPIKTNPKIDPFAGAALGYYIVSSSYNGTGIGGSYTGSASRMFLGGFGGARYYFKPNLSGVARVGFGASYLTLGVDYKMK
jgi:hypothetical protein